MSAKTAVLKYIGFQQGNWTRNGFRKGFNLYNVIDCEPRNLFELGTTVTMQSCWVLGIEVFPADEKTYETLKGER
jgi:hypothetical protein